MKGCSKAETLHRSSSPKKKKKEKKRLYAILIFPHISNKAESLHYNAINRSDVMEYSVDMVRFKTRVMKDDLNSLIYKLSIDSRVEYWQCYSFKSYHHNFRIQETEEFTYYLGIEHNTKRNIIKKDVVVEYNPNKFVKSTDSILYYILYNYFREKFIIVSLDIAIDVEIPINELYFDRNYKRNYKYFKSDTGETHYIGQGENRVKIYDKRKEQIAKGKKVDKEAWTRIEYSIRLDEVIENILKEEYYKKISTVDLYRKSKEYDYNDKTLKAIIYAVNNGYDIRELSRVYREKVKKIISNDKIDINEKDINECIKEFFKNYLEEVDRYIELFSNPFEKV